MRKKSFNLLDGHLVGANNSRFELMQHLALLRVILIIKYNQRFILTKNQYYLKINQKKKKKKIMLIQF